MKTIGLIGGMTWRSTLEYYRIINETVEERLGRTHSAKCIIYSIDFGELTKLQQRGDWEKITRLMVDISKTLEGTGADFIVICANTIHKIADDIQNNIKIPLLHIADATALKIKSQGLKRIGLLGTKLTMEGNFYREKLVGYGLEIIVPEKEKLKFVDDIIYNELCRGEVRDSSKIEMKKIIDGFAKKDAEGVILGCTELSFLISKEDSEIPLFDTLAIHARYAAECATS